MKQIILTGLFLFILAFGGMNTATADIVNPLILSPEQIRALITQLRIPDYDGDGVLNSEDNCAWIANPDQADEDQDGIGDSCDNGDQDGDGVPDAQDNCVEIPNPTQADDDNNGEGNECSDDDFDGIDNLLDNCPYSRNPRQLDRDDDGVGNICDNCRLLANPDQADSDGDYIGDACERDEDGDGVPNDEDNCIIIANPDQADEDQDDIGDACEKTLVSINPVTEEDEAGPIVPTFGFDESSCSLNASSNSNNFLSLWLIFISALGIVGLRRKLI